MMNVFAAAPFSLLLVSVANGIRFSDFINPSKETLDYNYETSCVLVKVYDENNEPVPIPDQTSMDIDQSSNRLSVQVAGGVGNSMFGSINITGPITDEPSGHYVEIGPISSTRKLPPPPIYEFEKTIRNMLPNMTEIDWDMSADNKVLVLTGVAGEFQCEENYDPPKETLDYNYETSCVLVEVHDENNEAVPVPDHTSMNIDQSSTRLSLRVAGGVGNNMFGSMNVTGPIIDESSGHYVEIGPIGSTKKLPPPPIYEFEQMIGSMLPNMTEIDWDMSGDNKVLVLTGVAGEFRCEENYETIHPSKKTLDYNYETSCVLDEVYDENNEAVPVPDHTSMEVDQSSTRLSLQVAGGVGNSMFGSMNVTGPVIDEFSGHYVEIGPIASTLKLPPPPIYEFEKTIWKMLPNMTQIDWDMSGDYRVLVLTGVAGGFRCVENYETSCKLVEIYDENNEAVPIPDHSYMEVDQSSTPGNDYALSLLVADGVGNSMFGPMNITGPVIDESSGHYIEIGLLATTLKLPPPPIFEFEQTIGRMLPNMTQIDWDRSGEHKVLVFMGMAGEIRCEEN